MRKLFFDPKQYPLRSVAERLFNSEKEEDDHLDYKDKRCLKGKGAEDLMYDFCAMANAEGGIIIIGVREENGYPTKPITRGLQSITSPDTELNRVDQMRNSKFGLTGPDIDVRSIRGAVSAFSSSRCIPPLQNRSG